MSPIAEVLAAMGHAVSGSDLHESAILDRLRRLGVAVHVGHDPLHVEGVDVVVISTAVPATNIEVTAARRASIPVLHRSAMLAAICRLRRTAAIAGTHGKTTTSALLAVALEGADLRPSFVVGGVILDLGTGARWDSGEWMVAEADESDGSFLRLPADLAVVTSVEPDHLDHWGSFDAVTAAFDTFLAAAGSRLVSADDAVAAELGRRHGATTYGTATTADVRMVEVVGGRTSVRFTLLDRGTVLGDVEIPSPGLHNARNAAGALAAAVLMGADFAPAAQAVASWGGVGRRFQARGEQAGVTFVDDYAHLPGEVEAVLAAARDGGWERVVCVFQPHRFSRTAGPLAPVRVLVRRRRPPRRHRRVPRRRGPSTRRVRAARRLRGGGGRPPAAGVLRGRTGRPRRPPPSGPAAGGPVPHSRRRRRHHPRRRPVGGVTERLGE